MKPILKRILIGVGAFACLAALAFIASIVLVMMPPLRSFSRTNEKLPTVFVENGSTVYCRMRYCDFRFPLPDKAHVVRTNIDAGGFDTIHGSIYIINSDGSPINLRHYAEFLQNKNWNVSVASGYGCRDITDNMKDVPFLSPTSMTHYPLFENFGASSTKQEGGIINAETKNGLTEISFSYFGDY